ncbi:MULTISPECIES: TetR/AcrR family transcriptional regulator [unclassified Isoptericola]|uniref:TetR/AcrR family transcriptional regulator n=1 Tax=unclassified Isoptericola TaxID=2623355 RepID=UPI0027138625|nr:MULTISPECIES: TetR/AcrR family transcriptional regulator [unclassified Isoptericola]MDO8143731.1 TetR/AcrR family transcriptional regulator [Isoptericola sp. 178]MDO8147629.1 TetR/AcrR family transcriptional regulator [Isoptericola sp. b515]MDO8150068.1 TetR/AcrR family transcriptional regulator [Isoptericola sp. b408]
MKFVPADILDAAVTLIDADGIGVSTAKVAAAAGVSNGTLFHYFRTKQDLLDELYLHLKRDLATAIGDVDATGSTKDRSRTIWDRWVAWGTAHPARHRVVLLLKGAGLIRRAAVEEAQTYFAAVPDVLAEAAADGQLVDMPLPYLAEVVETQIDLAVSRDLAEAERAVAFEMAWASITARNAAR